MLNLRKSSLELGYSPIVDKILSWMNNRIFPWLNVVCYRELAQIAHCANCSLICTISVVQIAHCTTTLAAIKIAMWSAFSYLVWTCEQTYCKEIEYNFITAHRSADGTIRDATQNEFKTAVSCMVHVIRCVLKWTKGSSGTAVQWLC